MTVITMSCTELSRLRVMIDLADGRTRIKDATALMGLQRRQSTGCWMPSAPTARTR